MQPSKPPIYLLVILPIMVGGGIFLVPKLLAYYASYKNIPLSAIPNKEGILIVIPAFFVWLPLALILSNFVLVAVPPLRKVAQDYARKSQHPGFLKSQLKLFVTLVVISIVCVPIIIYGFLH